MSIYRFYRLAMLLPIVVPILVIVGSYFFGLPISLSLSTLTLVLTMSGVFGAVPYSLLALWASRWISGRTESEIRRKALRAPLFMLAAFLPFPFLLSASGGDPVGEGIILLLLAVPAILILGYAYVGLVLWLQHLAEARGWLALETSGAA